MIGHHVTERSGHIKVAAAFFHTHGFRDGDLNMVNVAPVPDGFKNAVAETEHQDVLHSFFAKVVIDTENLTFSQHFADLAVHRFGRLQVIAKGLFKNYAPPVSVFLARQFRSAKMLDDIAKKSRTGSKIEKVVALRVVFLVDLGKRLSHSS